MNYNELRQLVTDFSVLLKDLEERFKTVKKELDEDREQEIRTLTQRIFYKEGKKLILNKYTVSQKVVKRMLKTIKKEIDKFDLDSMGQVLSRVKKMSDYEKFQVCEYILNEAQVKLLKRKANNKIFTGNLD